MPTSSLPPDDVIAEGWAQVADLLEPAHAAWEAVSPDTTGPITELLRHARWNATVWNLKSQGVDRRDAWRAADAEHGSGDGRYIDYEPDDSPEN